MFNHGVKGFGEAAVRRRYQRESTAKKRGACDPTVTSRSTTGAFANGSLTLSFDEYGTTLEATLKDGVLEGQYARGTRGAPYPFRAKRFVAVPAAADTAGRATGRRAAAELGQ